jgi:hypothetical protein
MLVLSALDMPLVLYLKGLWNSSFVAICTTCVLKPLGRILWGEEEI